MNKFHINSKGDASQCKATKGQCPFGDEEEHYATREEAQAAFERERAFDMLAKISSKSYKSVLQQQLASLKVAREEALDLQYSSFSRVQAGGFLGGYTWRLNVSDEEYENRRENAETLTRLTDEKAKELRAFKMLPHWKSDFPEAKNLSQARSEVMQALNRIGDEDYFSPSMDVYVQETLDRYHAGETIDEEEEALPSDKLLKVLTVEDNGIMSQQQVYNVLVFPEKDLKPVLTRLGIDDVRVAPLINGRENGLVYTVRGINGETRSFCMYEHRNTDSIIINGKTDWDPREGLPYASNSKEAFFAEFAPGDHRQAAETLGYFMSAAQRGDLETDEELAAMVSRRDWRAILSENIPGYAEWAARGDEEDRD